MAAPASSTSVMMVALLVFQCSAPLASAMSPFRMMMPSAERPVSVLDHNNFLREMETSGTRQWMVAFCNVDHSGGQPEPTGECRKLMPAFEKYAKDKWEQQMGRLAYGQVDCSLNQKLCDDVHAVPGSIVHFVKTRKIDEWTKRRQREGTLLFPWINRQVNDHDEQDGKLSKAAFEEATQSPWDIKYVAAIHILFVMFVAVPTAFAKLAGQTLWMVTFAGTLFVAVASLRFLSCPLLRPGCSSSNSDGQKSRSKSDDEVSALVQDVLF